MFRTAIITLGASALVTACAADEAATTTQGSLSTLLDVDLAPECQGILSYVNGAERAELGAVLPAAVADAVVARRAVAPFVDLADLSSVSGIAQGRLAQLTDRARTLGFVDDGCAGVYEELAVSADDRDAILAYLDAAPESELRAVARVDRDATAAALIARRPFSSLAAVVATAGVGPATFRSIRNAAVDDPFDDLIARVDAIGDVSISLNFDWYALMFDLPGQPRSMTCFGVPAEVVAQMGGTMRPNLADGAEVYAEVESTVRWANRSGGVGDTTEGLAHVAALVDGQTFLGCYTGFAPDPWSGVDRAFFVNTATGYRIFTETRWSE